MKQKKSVSWKTSNGKCPDSTANERIKGNEDTSRDLWENIKLITLVLLEFQKEKIEKSARKIFKEIIAENFLNLGKEKDNHVQEDQGVQIRGT